MRGATDRCTQYLARRWMLTCGTTSATVRSVFYSSVPLTSQDVSRRRPCAVAERHCAVTLFCFCHVSISSLISRLSLSFHGHSPVTGGVSFHLSARSSRQSAIQSLISLSRAHSLTLLSLHTWVHLLRFCGFCLFTTSSTVTSCAFLALVAL